MRKHTRNFDSAHVNIEASHERGAIMLKSLKIFSIFDSSFVSIARRMQLRSHNVYRYHAARSKSRVIYRCARVCICVYCVS